MSWPALKWAAEQRAGDPIANAVLRVRADHADDSGRVFIDAPAIANELETTKPTVLAADKRIIEKKLMQHTGDWAGKTRRVPVYQLAMPKQLTKETVMKRTRDGKETVKKR